MGTDKPVDFDGEFFQLRDAVLGLSPYEGRMPQLWLAAHGPRMLRITGRHADGWLPTNIRPDAYAEKLAAIRESAEKAGRDPDAIVAVDAGLRDLRARRGDARAHVRRRRWRGVLFAAVDLPAETYERHGSTSPFEGGTGFHSFIPTADRPREEVERIVSHIPGGIVREHTLAGTPEMIAEQIRTYAEAGLRDVVLWNITPFADPALSVYSFRAHARGARAARQRPEPRMVPELDGARRARHRRQPRHRARDRARAGRGGRARRRQLPPRRRGRGGGRRGSRAAARSRCRAR